MQWTCPIRSGAERQPEAPALTFGGRRWTYRELDTEVGRWVAALRSRLRFRPTESRAAS